MAGDMPFPLDDAHYKEEARGVQDGTVVCVDPQLHDGADQPRRSAPRMG